MMQRVNGNPFPSSVRSTFLSSCAAIATTNATLRQPMHQQPQYQAAPYASPASNELLHHGSLQNLQLSPSRGPNRPQLVRGQSDTHIPTNQRQYQPLPLLYPAPPPSFDPSRQPPLPPPQFGDGRSQPMYSAQVSAQELDEASQQPRTLEGNAMTGERAPQEDISVNPAHLSGDAEAGGYAPFF